MTALMHHTVHEELQDEALRSARRVFKEAILSVPRLAREITEEEFNEEVIEHFSEWDVPPGQATTEASRFRDVSNFAVLAVVEMLEVDKVEPNHRELRRQAYGFAFSLRPLLRDAGAVEIAFDFLPPIDRGVVFVVPCRACIRCEPVDHREAEAPCARTSRAAFFSPRLAQPVRG